jgi:hypothetical protein
LVCLGAAATKDFVRTGVSLFVNVLLLFWCILCVQDLLWIVLPVGLGLVFEIACVYLRAKQRLGFRWGRPDSVAASRAAERLQPRHQSVVQSGGNMLGSAPWMPLLPSSM